MSFLVRLTDAIRSRESLLVVGLDPNPELLDSWRRDHPRHGSLLSAARQWIRSVIRDTADHVCAYKPSLGFYQALGPIGLDLLREVRELIPPDLPLLVDAKHGDLNSASVLAQWLFRELGADAVSVTPWAGQDVAAPFLLHADRGVVVVVHSSSPAARRVQHHPDSDRPLFLQLVRDCQRWATPDQLLLEVGTDDPDLLARVRNEAPGRFLLLRSLWSDATPLEQLLAAGLGPAGDDLLLPLPQDRLVAPDLAAGTRSLRDRINAERQRLLDRPDRVPSDRCPLWLPAPAPGDTEALILALFDQGCLLFGDYVQASGEVFPYYLDLRTVISNPGLFQRLLHAYAQAMAGLPFDRLAGIPYGSLPTATGLSLQLHRPLIYPRKETKAHGTRRLIEGDYNPGDRVLVVDDVLISGGSMLDGVDKLRRSELVVNDVVVLVDHGSGGRDRLEAEGLRCHAVLTFAGIREVLQAAGRLSGEQLQRLSHGATAAAWLAGAALAAAAATLPVQAAPLPLRLAPLLQRDGLNRPCPTGVTVSETLQPQREGSYGSDGEAPLATITSGWRLDRRDAFSASWTAQVVPAYASCRAGAAIEGGYVQLRLWDGRARLTLEMTGLRDPNGYLPQITRAAVSGDRPVWSWAGSD